MNKVIRYETTKGPMDFRMLKDRPRKHHIGDIIEVTCDDGAIERHLVAQGSGCSDCDCFDDNTCIRWKTYRGSRTCILQYGYGRIAQKMVLKSIDNVMENL